jgi:hypothetical protein
MNDVREAVERIGRRLTPTVGDLDDLSRRRNRARVRQRIAAVSVALTVATAGGLLLVRAFVISAPGASTIGAASSSSPSTTLAEGQPECPSPSADTRPRVSLSATSGQAGSSVDVSGTFESGERWLQLWWNADEDTTPASVDRPPWPSGGPDLRFGAAGSGPVLKLDSVPAPASGENCSWHSEFTVPDVSPGSYPVVSVVGTITEQQGQDAYALWVSSIMFEVTG